jgi:O-antigen ligase
MWLSVKELIIALTIAGIIFSLARPTALTFCDATDYVRRRNSWMVLTSAAFLCPFWLYAVVAIPILLISARKEKNPSACYLLLLHVAPPVSVTVPMIGLSRLFDIDNYLLLSFFLLTPIALRLRKAKGAAGSYESAGLDILLLSYGVLQSCRFVLPEIAPGIISAFTATDAIRRAFVFFFSVYIPFYVIGRSIRDQRQMLEAMAMFCLACGLLSSIAIFESLDHWLIYGEFADRWGVGSNFTAYVGRGSSLRASASTGNPLALGYLVVIAIAFWNHLADDTKSRLATVGANILYGLGLFFSFSRGPWLGLGVFYFIKSALSPQRFKRTLRFLLFTGCGIAAILATPAGDKLIAMLPFLGGTVDADSVGYRQRLFDRAWQLIGDSPFLGSPDALLQMQDLRNGQGIIDLVNTYVDILLGTGFVGLALLGLFFVIATLRCFVMSQRVLPVDLKLGMMGILIVSCCLTTAVLLWNVSFLLAYERMFYVLVAMAIAYHRFCRQATIAPHSGRSRS